MSVKIGKARFGGQFQQRKYFKLKDGEQAFRILPPLGELADSGRWSLFYSVHYGYKTSDGKQKPFLSPEVKNKKNGMVEVLDSAKDRITSLKVKYEEARKSGNKAAFDKLNDLVGPTGMYNLDNNHFMNVIDAQGNIGVLKLRHKAKLALETEIKKLNSDGVDPLSPETGRFFVFTRTGMGRDTTFSVNVLKEKLTVEKVGVVERDVVHVLDDELLKRLGSEAAELDKLFRRFTSEEVKNIVESSDLMTGVSTYLDEVYNKTKSTEPSSNNDSHEEEKEVEILTAPAVSVAAPSAKTPVVQTPAKIAVKPTATVLTEMSDEAFLEALNNGTL